MEDPVRTDLLKLFRANPLLRDTPQVLATRLGRSVPAVEKALQSMETDGLVARRWVADTALYFFTGAPDGPANAGKVADAAPTSPDRQEPPLMSACILVPSSLDGIHRGRTGVEGLCRSAGMPPPLVMEFAIALSEALTNAFRYGRRGNDRDTIRISFRARLDQVEVEIKDRGSGFPFLLVGSSASDSKSTGGRGLMLMRSLTDDMEINRTPSGTLVRLVKKFPAAEAEHPVPKG